MASDDGINQYTIERIIFTHPCGYAVRPLNHYCAANPFRADDAVCPHIVPDAAIARNERASVLYHPDSLDPRICSPVHKDRGTWRVLVPSPLIS